LLWNGTIKSTDWITTWIITIDVNLVLFSIFLYFVFRIYIIYNINIFPRIRNKIKIINSLNTLFLNNLFKFLLK
jgi:hypothetical protein